MIPMKLKTSISEKHSIAFNTTKFRALKTCLHRYLVTQTIQSNQEQLLNKNDGST